MLKKNALACVAFLAAVNILNVSLEHFFVPRLPNVLLVVADALRADHLGCYGYSRPVSPFIDKFAEESVLFEKHLSNSPWTKPSMGTIFTSLYPYEHRAFFWTDNLSSSSLSLAEIFRNKNYRTLAIQTNTSITTKHNFSQGFQEYRELPLKKGDAVTNEFITWLRKTRKKPFFAYLHYMDTHMPYNAPEEFSRIFQLENSDSSGPVDFKTLDIRILTRLGIEPQEQRSLIELYNRAVKDIDHNFKRIIGSLQKQGLLENTIVIFTSDHGEEFWDHEGFAHGHTLYNELLHVPLIVHYPLAFRPSRVTPYTQHADIFPTVLSMTGIQKAYESKGNDMTPLFFSGNEDAERVLFFEGLLFGAEKRGVIQDGWKLIENTTFRGEDTLLLLGDLEKFGNSQKNESFELYDLNQDFSERENKSERFPQIVDLLKKHLLLKTTSGIDLIRRKKTRLEEKRESLKTLGYIK